MRVLVAGSTGVIGRQLVPLLEAVGHEVIPGSRATGLDALDRQGTAAFVRNAAPDVIVHLLTSIPKEVDPRRFAAQFAMTDRLRTEGARNLLDAAPQARIVAQSVAFAYEPGEGLANEDTPLWADPPKAFAGARDAVMELERLTGERGGLVLRFGHLTGPGTVFGDDGSTTLAVRAGKLPIVGDGASVFSFTHTHDAATSIVAALDREVGGVLNVVDDHPTAVRDWLPALAALLGAPAPKRVPAFAARLAVGGWGTAFMTRLRGADNSRARLRLNWRPRFETFLRETA
ncbi:NAD(P)-dependent oxidoreductase [Nonomuraea sp. NBC_01738]|uniref:NAD-dependent epimerase/dehydratase family protein n=1 Tax=Nonomuraea sp. NBC_01738 TaxID=2976003 RepID=UPI002E110B8C|nr:NAD(P)-dependent oxidoreductase [Nonomuraea sp. NBC_01738]